MTERSANSTLSRLTDFYAGKRVLVTGHTGFKGSWLTAWLVALGAEVIGLSLDDAAQNGLYRRCALDEQIDTTWVDVRDTERVREAFYRYLPEIVFHLAGQAVVRRSYADPTETFDINVMGTANVLDAAAKVGSVRAVVCVTSDKCYGDAPGIRTEEDLLMPDDPYSCSKAAAEMVIRAYRAGLAWLTYAPNEKLGMAVASARSGNAIGGGDWGMDRLVPDVIRAMRASKPIHLRKPGARRPWQHVLEPLAGYLMLGAELAQGKSAGALAYNFGPDYSGHESVDTLVKIFLDVAKATDYPVSVCVEELHEADELIIDSKLASRDLRWRPVWDLHSAIHYTLEWYDACEQMGVKELRALTLRQIEEFTEGFARLEGVHH